MTHPINHLLYWIAGRLPLRIISEDGRPYLERYYLFTLFGVRAYLHRFVGSDPARGLHDHPWPWAGSIILHGHYFEHTRAGIAKVRWLNWLAGDSFHRVVLPVRLRPDAQGMPEAFEKPCWSLFFHRAKYVKTWGFMRAWPNAATMLWSKHGEQDPQSGGTDWWRRAPKGRDEPRRMAA